jgi:hypothetical protein
MTVYGPDIVKTEHSGVAERHALPVHTATMSTPSGFDRGVIFTPFAFVGCRPIALDMRGNDQTYQNTCSGS